MSITEEIQRLKKEKNAVILAHYYVAPEVQEIADYVGDSFYLSKAAVDLKERTIVFCGVSFMGESAKILNPNKTVLMPELSADCAMAHMADAETIQRMREEYEDLAVVCYINSTAELKKHSDVCVTSSNAVKIVEALPNRNIFFIPDRNLAHFVAEQVPKKHFVYNEGYCPVHEKMAVHEIQKEKELHPQAEILTHPECPHPGPQTQSTGSVMPRSPETVHREKELHPQAEILTHPECPQAVREMSDYIGSTSGIIAYAHKSECQEFIICTETGVRFELERQNPGKRFYFTETEPVCQDMKMITLEKIRDVLKNGENEIHVTKELREGSVRPLERMLELA